MADSDKPSGWARVGEFFAGGVDCLAGGMEFLAKGAETLAKNEMGIPIEGEESGDSSEPANQDSEGYSGTNQ